LKPEIFSLDLSDILRGRIDECARFKPAQGQNLEIINRLFHGDILSEKDKQKAEAALISQSIKIFLNSKEGLVIPDDALHRVATETIKKNLTDLDITLSYQDFYAYQFVDKLNQIVRRAFTISDLFAKNSPPEKIKHLCSEAYQCYLYGYFTSSVALIRSLVETALKDRLSSNKTKFYKLNNEGLSRGIYPPKIWKKIDQIREKGNEFLHEAIKGNIPDEKENFNLLILAQDVLQAIIV